MASLLVKHSMVPASRVLASGARASLFTKSAAALTAHQRISSPRRCFSQTLRRAEKLYTESHEWIDRSPDGKTYKVGISTYAAEALGDVVYVELPETGEEIEEGEPFGSVESVKSASEIASPAGGTVVAVNEGVVESPADLGKDPEGEGWLLEVEGDASGVEGLMDAAAYAEFTKEE